MPSLSEEDERDTIRVANSLLDLAGPLPLPATPTIATAPALYALPTLAAAPAPVAPPTPVALLVLLVLTVQSPLPPYTANRLARVHHTATTALREGYIPMDEFFTLVLAHYHCEKPHYSQKAKGYPACYELPDSQHLLLDGRLIA